MSILLKINFKCSQSEIRDSERTDCPLINGPFLLSQKCCWGEILKVTLRERSKTKQQQQQQQQQQQ